MSKKRFYTLSFTWGLPMTLIGCVVALALLMTGHKPKKYGYCICFEVGTGWGGVSFGPVMVSNKRPSTHLKNHEHGHALQNCYWGFLMPFAIGLPSTIRYWYREHLVKTKQATRSSLPKYDNIWFEGDATKRGTEFMKSLGENNGN